MPLHPQAAQAILRAGDLPIDLTPADLRIAYERQRLTLLPEKPQVAITYQLSIPSDYGPIPARFYRATRETATAALLVYCWARWACTTPPAGGWRLPAIARCCR